jgi:glycosyltransferase involved in cell wall biosynthesis
LSKKPRLTYILHSYYSKAGTELHTRALEEAFGKEYSVSVIFREKDSVIAVSEDKILFELRGDPNVWPETPFRSLRTEESLQKILSALKPDIIHIQHFLNWPLSLFEQALAATKNVVLSFHDYFALSPDFTMQEASSVEEIFTPSYCEKRFGRDITGYLLRRSELLYRSFAKLSSLITPSHFLATILRERFPLNFTIIEHGIRQFQPSARPKHDGLTFGYFGGYVVQKGYVPLFEAFSKLHEEFPSSALKVYGAKGAIAPLAALPDGAEYLQSYETHEIPSALRNIDVGVIPSLFRETYSLILSELWMGKRPVAASRLGALAERITDGADGKFFVPGDAESIRETLQWFLVNDSWRSWDFPTPRSETEMLSDYSMVYERLLQPK